MCFMCGWIHVHMLKPSSGCGLWGITRAWLWGRRSVDMKDQNIVCLSHRTAVPFISIYLNIVCLSHRTAVHFISGLLLHSCLME